MCDSQEFEIEFLKDVLSHKKDYIEVVKLLSSIYGKQLNYPQALKMDKQLIKLKPHCETAHYNHACTLALMGKETAAIKALTESFRLGFRDLDWLMEDPDMEDLRKSSKFQKLIKELKGNLDLNF